MNTSIAGRNIIKEFEGFRGSPYMCPAGYLTVGYGHRVKKSEKFGRITMREGEALLVKDLEPVENAIDYLVTAPLSQNQYDALASLIYNIGSGNFMDSTLRKFLNAGDYAQAAGEFTRWVYTGSKRLPGLVARREAEQKLFLAT